MSHSPAIYSNASLVEHLWRNGFITTQRVKSAFLKVDRANYAPGDDPYKDTPQIISSQATISSPSIHAQAVELLLPYLLPVSGNSTRPRRVLDIGSGSGFLVHVFAELAGDKSVVIGVDHQDCLKKLGETNMGKSADGATLLASGQARFRLGDGRNGWVEPDSQPSEGWDAIHVGATSNKLHPELLQQLRSPGRIFIPLTEEEGNWLSETYIWLVDKDEIGNITMTKCSKANFVSLMDVSKIRAA